MNKRFIPGLLLAGLLGGLLGAETPAPKDDSGRIRIAIPGFERIGSIPEADWKQINYIVVNTFIKNKAFEVVERDEEAMQKLAKEREFQDQGNLVDANSDQLIKYGKLQGVRQLLLGSVGTLFGKLVITVRLVDAETGKNLFAETLPTTTDEKFFVEIEVLSQTISTRALESNRTVTKEEIKKLFEERKYVEASAAIEAFRIKKALDPEIENIWKTIGPMLAQDFYKQAERFIQDRDYKKAREAVERSLAYQLDDKAILLRTRIINESLIKEKEQEELALVAQKKLEQEKQRKIAESLADPFESSETYFRQLSPLGHHVAASLAKEVQMDLVIPSTLGDWGVDYVGVFRLSEPEYRGAFEVNFVNYLGLGVQYYQSFTPIRLHAEAYLSPLTTSLKLANLINTLGIDVGVQVTMDNSISGGSTHAFTLGALEMLELRFVRSLGIFAGLKADYIYYPNITPSQKFQFRFMAGLTF